MRGERAVSKAEVPARSKERRAELSPGAQRALAEAEARRREAAQHPSPPDEIGGRPGPDPARYGDWEVKGIASDF
ncbi:MAG: DUF1674 domain-containing protein [Methylocystis sp.]|nr:DUF1674 domain-containing protein [Methylocystis sp.]